MPDAAAPPAGPVEEVLASAAASGLLPAGEPVVVLLSGGRDSICLLDVAVRLAGAAAVRALHVDYGLRSSAGADAAFCASRCAALGVALEVERAGAPPAGNVQDWARELRYAAAARLAGPVGARIAAGHTATDLAETVLYRLAASPGRRALLGMPRRRGALVRPLLDVTREQTTAYCRARGLTWREDATNDSGRYARGRVRGALVPALRALHPAAERNVVRTAELLRDEAAVLDALVDDILGGADAIALERLAELAPALRRLVARRLAEDVAGRLVPDAATRVDELLALAGRPGGAALDLGGGVRAHVERGLLRFAPTPPLPAREPRHGRRDAAGGGREPGRRGEP